MKNRNIYLIATLLLIGSNIQAQQGEIHDVLAGLKKKINLRFRISDSLPPTSIKKLDNLQHDLSLSKQEVREVRKANTRIKGMKLDNTLLDGVSFISASSIYKAYQFADSSSLSFIERNKPFYILSFPLFFDNGQKAIIDLDLIGRGGYTYLLVKRNDKWVIDKEMVRWVI
ncbi:MAG TPA: hypothetical protein VK563_00195 [Puia sp.]|nr:hypothetical protein [Puia sp.]